MTSKDFGLGADKRKEILKTSTMNSLNDCNKTKQKQQLTLFSFMSSLKFKARSN